MNTDYRTLNSNLNLIIPGFEKNFKIGNMNVTYTPQFGGVGGVGTHYDGTVTSLSLSSYGSLSVSYDDSVEISPEGQAALDEAMSEKEKNYASMVGEMSRRLKDIFNALVAWSKDIIQKTRGDNNDAFGAKNIAETIENSLSNFEEETAEIDAEVGEINHKDAFKSAVSKYYQAFKNTVAELFEEAKENAENLDGEFPDEKMGELLEMLKEVAESGEEIFVWFQETFFSDGKRFLNIEQANEQDVRDLWSMQTNVQMAQMSQAAAHAEINAANGQASLPSPGAANIAENKIVDDPALQALIDEITAKRQEQRNKDIALIQSAGMSTIMRGLTHDGNGVKDENGAMIYDLNIVTEHDLSVVSPVVLDPNGNALPDPYESHVKFLVAGAHKRLEAMERFGGMNIADIPEDKILGVIEREVPEKFKHLYA